uniref:Uncharacterized protein n=1 Tax=Aegilops tauschii subsp. strangulata TaxID=200361 RepID=A0A453Q1M4_AEGTS
GVSVTCLLVGATRGNQTTGVHQTTTSSQPDYERRGSLLHATHHHSSPHARTPEPIEQTRASPAHLAAGHGHLSRLQPRAPRGPVRHPPPQRRRLGLGRAVRPALGRAPPAVGRGCRVVLGGGGAGRERRGQHRAVRHPEEAGAGGGGRAGGGRGGGGSRGGRRGGRGGGRQGGRRGGHAAGRRGGARRRRARAGRRGRRRRGARGPRRLVRSQRHPQARGLESLGSARDVFAGPSGVWV